tara:strand:- start:1987 stop:2157 length:171 start_codon:yes stop_codon:yes gene_type:complete
MTINEIREALKNAYYFKLDQVQTSNRKEQRKKEQLERALLRALDHAISLDNMQTGC